MCGSQNLDPLVDFREICEISGAGVGFRGRMATPAAACFRREFTGSVAIVFQSGLNRVEPGVKSNSVRKLHSVYGLKKSWLERQGDRVRVKMWRVGGLLSTESPLMLYCIKLRGAIGQLLMLFVTPLQRLSKADHSHYGWSVHAPAVNSVQRGRGVEAGAMTGNTQYWRQNRDDVLRMTNYTRRDIVRIGDNDYASWFKISREWVAKFRRRRPPSKLRVPSAWSF